jgi:hypothetical protein
LVDTGGRAPAVADLGSGTCHDGTCQFDKFDRSIFLKFRRMPAGFAHAGSRSPGRIRGVAIAKSGPVMPFRNAVLPPPHAITAARPWLLAGNPHPTQRPA